MKLTQLHIILIWLLIITNYQAVYCASVFQEPEQIRQFNEDFKDHYTGNKYNYEGKKIVNKTPSGSGKYEDYKNKKPRIKDKNDSNNYSFNLGPLSWLFYAALIIAVVYLVYVLFNNGGAGLFSYKQHQKINNYEEITAENIENADISSLIKNAENNDDYRLAIRFYYLLVLKNLSLKNFIKFEDDKTNAEYLNEISNKPFSSKFAYTSYLYNYIWYGEFPLDTEKYRHAKSNFTALLKQIK